MDCNGVCSIEITTKGSLTVIFNTTYTAFDDIIPMIQTINIPESINGCKYIEIRVQNTDQITVVQSGSFNNYALDRFLF